MEPVHTKRRGSAGKGAEESNKDEQRILNISVYEERLVNCVLTTLDKRRCRGDLIETYTLITNKETKPLSRFFQLADRSGLRGHRYKKIFRKAPSSKCSSATE